MTITFYGKFALGCLLILGYQILAFAADDRITISQKGGTLTGPVGGVEIVIVRSHPGIQEPKGPDNADPLNALFMKVGRLLAAPNVPASLDIPPPPDSPYVDIEIELEGKHWHMAAMPEVKRIVGGAKSEVAGLAAFQGVQEAVLTYLRQTLKPTVSTYMMKQ